MRHGCQRMFDSEADRTHLFDKLKLFGENPIRKGEDISGVGRSVFCRHREWKTGLNVQRKDPSVAGREDTDKSSGRRLRTTQDARKKRPETHREMNTATTRTNNA
jgi:hypothetical protein